MSASHLKRFRFIGPLWSGFRSPFGYSAIGWQTGTSCVSLMFNVTSTSDGLHTTENRSIPIRIGEWKVVSNSKLAWSECASGELGHSPSGNPVGEWKDQNFEWIGYSDKSTCKRVWKSRTASCHQMFHRKTWVSAGHWMHAFCWRASQDYCALSPIEICFKFHVG